MAKPTQLPRWATTGVVTPEPSEGQKDTGWVVSQRPPRNYFNWWQNLVYQWCVYLDGITNEALTWAAAQVFSAKATFSAGATISVAPIAATDVARKFDVDAEATARGSAIASEAGARSIADALKANDNAVVHLTGTEAVAGVKTFSSSPSVPTPVAAADAATKGYVDVRAAKAWVLFTAGAAGACTINAAHNVSLVTWGTNSPNSFVVTFGTALSSAVYGVAINIQDTLYSLPATKVSPGSLTASSFGLYQGAIPGGGPITVVPGVQIFVSVFGANAGN